MGDLEQILTHLTSLNHEVGRLAGAQEALVESTSIMRSEVTDRLSRLRCEAHQGLLEEHARRMDRLRESVDDLIARRPPTGEVAALATEAAEEVTGEIRVDVLREAEAAAKRAAVEALRQRERDKEEESELSAKRIERYLRIVAGVLAITGIGWVASVAKACSLQAEMASAAKQQTQELRAVQQEVTLMRKDARR